MNDVFLYLLSQLSEEDKQKLEEFILAHSEEETSCTQ